MFLGKVCAFTDTYEMLVTGDKSLESSCVSHELHSF